jgi:isopenicillin-N epimerase
MKQPAPLPRLRTVAQGQVLVPRHMGKRHIEFGLARVRRACASMMAGNRRLIVNRFNSRRSFFNLMAASAISGAVAHSAEPDRESYWRVVRSQFSFHEDQVPMNAANLCPTPAQVASRVEELTHDVDVDCSFQNRAKFANLREDTRSKVAAQLGVSVDEIALVRNTSEANNTISNGIQLKAGDEIVIWEQNHPTNNVAWEVRAKRFGYRVTKVSLPAHPKSADDLIGPFEKALSGRTRVLALTHVSNVSGFRLPVKELAQIAHRRGIHVHLDGAQSWGAHHVDLKDLGCDSYAASAHKWYCGPREVGLLYVRDERIAAIWPQVVAPGWGDTPETVLKGSRKFESMGQRDDAALAGVGAAAEFQDTIGVKRIDERVTGLAAELKSLLLEAGAKLTTPESPALSGGVCIMQVPEANRAKVFEAMYTEFGIAGSTSGGLRLCPAFYNTREHVQRAAEGVKKLRHLWV